jgi:signal transduction histidine kinase
MHQKGLPHNFRAETTRTARRHPPHQKQSGAPLGNFRSLPSVHGALSCENVTRIPKHKPRRPTGPLPVKSRSKAPAQVARHRNAPWDAALPRSAYRHAPGGGARAGTGVTRQELKGNEARAGRHGDGLSATRHGRELMRQGYTVEQVVRDYGDLCQEITGLAMERDVVIKVDEFRTLNRCLDDGIADAVTEFAYQRDALMADSGAESLNERLGFLAHEARNHVLKAMIAIKIIKSGKAGLAGATGIVLDRSLIAMSRLIDRSLAEVRMNAGMPARYQLISVADFISDVRISASLEANVYECSLTVPNVDPTLAVDADRDMLFSAVGNLLQNAFKFTAHRSEVKLNAYAEADRILITVEDSGHGLAPGEAEKIFQPFTQSGADKSGVGLGLAICRRVTEINNGVLSVRNVPGSGCVFTIDLPRHTLPDPTR